MDKGVNKCRDIETGKIVAVKEYIDDASNDAKHLQNVRKLFIDGSIRNDHLAPYLNAAVENDKSYVVMPLYEKDLAQELETRRNKEPKAYMREEEIVKIFIQIVYGVDFLHKNGLIHRDLKLKSVMISKDGSIKIVDYNSMRPIEAMSTAFGTYLYTAPEVVKDNLMNEKSDIYAIGVMLFEMIALVSATTISSKLQTHFKLETAKEELYVHTQMNDMINQNQHFTSAHVLKRLIFSIVQHTATKRPTLDVIIRIFSIILNKEQTEKERSIESFGLKPLVPDTFLNSEQIATTSINNNLQKLSIMSKWNKKNTSSNPDKQESAVVVPSIQHFENVYRYIISGSWDKRVKCGI